MTLTSLDQIDAAIRELRFKVDSLTFERNRLNQRIADLHAQIDKFNITRATLDAQSDRGTQDSSN